MEIMLEVRGYWGSALDGLSSYCTIIGFSTLRSKVIDLVTGLPHSEGNYTISDIVDRFSKDVPLKKILSALETANQLVTGIFFTAWNPL